MEISPVQSEPDGTYTYRCPRPAGCGADGQPFTSTGWSDRDGAERRGAEHEAEHDEREV